MNRRVRLIIVIAVTVGLCIGSCLLIRAYNSYAFRVKLAQHTSPVEGRVAEDLCRKLALSEDDWRCQPEAVVYAVDFYESIGRPFEYGQTTYDDVQALFAEYQYDCESRESVAAIGYTRFRCRYDFDGDRIFWVSFSFDLEDETLLNIMPVVFDSG